MSKLYIHKKNSKYEVYLPEGCTNYTAYTYKLTHKETKITMIASGSDLISADDPANCQLPCYADTKNTCVDDICCQQINGICWPYRDGACPPETELCKEIGPTPPPAPAVSNPSL